MNGKCILCNEYLNKKPLYICNNMPQRVQNLLTKEELKGDVGISFGFYQCLNCGLLQLDGSPVDYYRDSVRVGERSEGLINIRKEQYKHFIEKYSLKGKKIIEIGAGKGGFLKTLKEMSEYNIEEYGLEYNKEFVKIAREKEKVNVIQGFCENENYIIAGSPFDAFMSFSYLARLIEPNILLKAIYNNLKENGMGYISCISQEHIMKSDGLYEITRDLYAYYSTDTLRFLAQKNGFDVLEVFEKDPYVSVVVKKRSPLDLHKIWSGADKINASICDFISNEQNNNRKVAVWCAGHYALTVISMTGIGNRISYIVDNSPEKQGRYAPASHVPIVSPHYYKEYPVDTFIIMGMMYADEIIRQIRKECSKTAKIALINSDGLALVE